MEMISDKPLEVNLENMRRLKRDYPGKVMIASIMGSDDGEWRTLAQKVTDIGADMIECNFSCPQMTSSTMGSDVGRAPNWSHAIPGPSAVPPICPFWRK